MEYIGFWNNKYHYMPPVKVWGLNPCYPDPLVYKCPCCLVRWLRWVTVDLYVGVCYWCYLEHFEGEEVMVF